MIVVILEVTLSANAGDYAKMSTAAVTGQSFKSALRIEVTKKPPRSGDAMISAPVDAAMASGDVLLVSFWLRSGAALRGAGFLGDYEIEVKAGGMSKTVRVSLPKKGAKAECVLE